MKNRIERRIFIEELMDITEEEFEQIISYDWCGIRSKLPISQMKQKSVSMMLFEGNEKHYLTYLEIYKTNTKIYIKYRKNDFERNETFIKVAKSPILHEGKIQSDEIAILKTVLKTKFNDSFIDLVCYELDEFLKIINIEEKSVEKQPKVLKKIKQ